MASSNTGAGQRGLTEVTVPHLAESLVSATVGKWLKSPGDYVREYDVLCELYTNKVNTEMPSPVEGVLVEILVEEGVEADVGAPICLIREQGQAADEEAPAAVDLNSSSSVMKSVESAVHEESERNSNAGAARFSPVVLHLAKEMQIDLNQVKGTGLGGRITRKDVLNYIESGRNPTGAAPVTHFDQITSAGRAASANAIASASKAATAAAVASAAPVRPAPQSENETPLQVSPGDEIIPLTQLRKTIAKRMHQSVTEIPHAWMMVEADVSGLVALRGKLKDDFKRKEGVNLTFFPFVLKAVVNAIKEFPIINSVWNGDGITLKRDIHLSIAVGSEESVVTPVLKHADRKTIAGIALELDDLARRARIGKLTLSDFEGGTLTVNNTGAFGSVLSYPIINAPQAAIITFESIVRRAVVVGDCIGIRSMANLCLSLDHRVLDGVICGKFLQRVKQNLEQYSPNTSIY